MNPSSFAPLIFVFFELEFVLDFLMGKEGPNLLVSSELIDHGSGLIWCKIFAVLFEFSFCSRRCLCSISLVSQFLRFRLKHFVAYALVIILSRGIRVSWIE